MITNLIYNCKIFMKSVVHTKIFFGGGRVAIIIHYRKSFCITLRKYILRY